MKKILAICLCISLLVGYFAVSPKVTKAEAKVMTMETFYSCDKEQLEGDYRVTISTPEEFKLLATYWQEVSERFVNGEDVLSVFWDTNITYELINDLQMSPYTYEYDSESDRIQIYYEDTLEACYSPGDKAYYPDLNSTEEISYKWKTESLDCIRNRYCQNFDGNGHTISGIYQKKRSTEMADDSTGFINTGLFCYFNKVENLVVEDAFVIGDGIGRVSVLGTGNNQINNIVGKNIQMIGEGDMGFLGYTDLTDIRNVDLEGNAFSTESGSVGILASRCDGNVLNCRVKGYAKILTDGSGYGCIGGICGLYNPRGNDKVIQNCQSQVVLAGKGAEYGGICGKVYGTENANIIDCQFDGEIHGYDDPEHRYKYSVGGICGAFKGRCMNQCVNTGNVTGYVGYVGGLVGQMVSGEIINCVNRGNIGLGYEGKNYYDGEELSAGGLLGFSGEYTDSSCDMLVCNSYNLGNVKSISGSYGGVQGLVYGDKFEIQNVYTIPVKEDADEYEQAFGKYLDGSINNYHVYEEEEAEALCQLLNDWVDTVDVEEHYMVEKYGKIAYSWEVLPGEIGLVQPTPTPTPVPTATATPTPTSTPTSTPAPIATSTPSPSPSLAPTETPEVEETEEPSPSPDYQLSIFYPTEEPTLTPDVTRKPVATQKATATPAATASQKAEETDASTSAESSVATGSRSCMAAPTFKLYRRKAANGQKYILLKIKKYKGKYVEVWVGSSAGEFTKV
ncbi:MAG: hypothetical protein K6G62_01735, partial [Eubacterium sp.]|nr:hypothetical protein [Eubacterium sp.]